MSSDVVNLELEQAKKRFNTLHTSVLAEISSMLRKAKLMPLVDLVSHNPTFTEMVEQLEEFKSAAEQIASIFEIGAEDTFAMINTNIALARQLANAIEDECHDSLGAAVAALDEKPFI